MKVSAEDRAVLEFIADTLGEVQSRCDACGATGPAWMAGTKHLPDLQHICSGMMEGVRT